MLRQVLDKIYLPLEFSASLLWAVGFFDAVMYDIHRVSTNMWNICFGLYLTNFAGLERLFLAQELVYSTNFTSLPVLFNRAPPSATEPYSLYAVAEPVGGWGVKIACYAVQPRKTFHHNGKISYIIQGPTKIVIKMSDIQTAIVYIVERGRKESIAYTNCIIHFSVVLIISVWNFQRRQIVMDWTFMTFAIQDGSILWFAGVQHVRNPPTHFMLCYER